MSSVIIQEIHIVKEVFGEAVIDAIIKTVEDAIKNAPKSIDPNAELPNALYMFADLLYDDNGLCRLESFEQYGTLYVAKIYDKTATGDKKEIYLAYSLFDIIETFNKIGKKSLCRVPYIRVTSARVGTTLKVAAVDAPKSYEDHCKICDYEKALNEIGKYKFSFTDGDIHTVFDVICNTHLISASNAYEDIAKTEFVKNICGEVIIGETGYIIEDLQSEPIVFTREKAITKEFCKDGNVIHPVSDVFEQAELADIEKTITIPGLESYPADQEFEFYGWIKEGEIDPIHHRLLDNYVLEAGVNRYFPVYAPVIREPVIGEFNSIFVTDVHAGTGTYGNSADAEPVDQNSNQNKLTIDTFKEGEQLVIDLKGSGLIEWLSTNPNQQDATHKWFALDFVFDPEKLAAGVIWCNQIEVTSDILDAAEGENTLTLWLKVDELANGATKTVTLTDKDNPEIKETIVIRFTEE